MSTPPSGTESCQSELTVFRRSASEIVQPDGRGKVDGEIQILDEGADRRGRSSASLLDGTVLVGSSRQPFLDAARVLIAAGYPASWVEGWRPGATAFALRARLGIAAGLTVDETRTVFAPWKPFSPSAVSSSIQYSEQAATTVAPAPRQSCRPRQNSNQKRRRLSRVLLEQPHRLLRSAPTARGRRVGPADPMIALRR